LRKRRSGDVRRRRPSGLREVATYEAGQRKRRTLPTGGALTDDVEVVDDGVVVVLASLSRVLLIDIFVGLLVPAETPLVVVPGRHDGVGCGPRRRPRPTTRLEGVLVVEHAFEGPSPPAGRRRLLLWQAHRYRHARPAVRRPRGRDRRPPKPAARGQLVGRIDVLASVRLLEIARERRCELIGGLAGRRAGRRRRRRREDRVDRPRPGARRLSARAARVEPAKDRPAVSTLWRCGRCRREKTRPKSGTARRSHVRIERR
jgi:hypothetical protein